MEIVCENYITFTSLRNFFKVTTVILLGLFISVKKTLVITLLWNGKSPGLDFGLGALGLGLYVEGVVLKYIPVQRLLIQ